MRIFMAAIALSALALAAACASPDYWDGPVEESGPPELFTIVPDDYHVPYAGTAEDGRKFFLSDELFDIEDEEATAFVALFLWHADGTFDEVQVERVNRAEDLPPGQAFSAGADDLVDKYLRQLGKYTMEPITVEPFTTDVDGVMFGWEIGQYPDGQYYVGIRPGDFVVYYAPWDGEEYDT